MTSPATFADLRPAAVYTPAEVATLFRVGVGLVRAWCRSGRLATLPRATGHGEFRILGSAALLLAGLPVVPPKPETAAERTKRAMAARERIKAMA